MFSRVFFTKIRARAAPDRHRANSGHVRFGSPRRPKKRSREDPKNDAKSLKTIQNRVHSRVLARFGRNIAFTLAFWRDRPVPIAFTPAFWRNRDVPIALTPAFWRDRDRPVVPQRGSERDFQVLIALTLAFWLLPAARTTSRRSEVEKR